MKSGNSSRCNRSRLTRVLLTLAKLAFEVGYMRIKHRIGLLGVCDRLLSEALDRRPLGTARKLGL